MLGSDLKLIMLWTVDIVVLFINYVNISSSYFNYKMNKIFNVVKVTK